MNNNNNNNNNNNKRHTDCSFAFTDVSVPKSGVVFRTGRCMPEKVQLHSVAGTLRVVSGTLPDPYGLSAGTLPGPYGLSAGLCQCVCNL